MITLALLLVVSAAFAKKKPVEQKEYKVACIAFYNLENLFDTIHDEGHNDYEYLPDGGMHWGTIKYTNKIKNMAHAISQFGKDETPLGAACVGVCECENIGALTDLANELKRIGSNYEPILLEGPDRRGVDCGFLYNPDLFQVTNVRGHELNAHYPDGGKVRSRLQLLVSGYLKIGHMEKIHIIVNHWPSPFGGKERTEAVRDSSALLSKAIVDSIRQREPNAKVIIMGDLNEDPNENACANMLGAKQYREDVEKGGFFNTMWQHLENGTGSIFYNGVWSLFDQIIITDPFLTSNFQSWTYWKSQVFNKPFLSIQEGKDKGGPFRTHKSGVWQNGYGDHFPTMIYLLKETDK